MTDFPNLTLKTKDFSALLTKYPQFSTILQCHRRPVHASLSVVFILSNAVLRGLRFQMADVFLTPEGLAKLEAELKELKFTKRKVIVLAIQEARAQGDLSENAEYDAAKEAQALNEKRINELEDMMTRAKLIDESNVPKDKVSIGKWVRLMNTKVKKEVKYWIVSPEEADFAAGKLSMSSPIGKALVGRLVGEEVSVTAPAGVTVYKLLEMGM
jgi:transcription elongation factor GreA